MNKPDIDIDTPSSFNPLDYFPDWTRASQCQDGKLRPHPCGVYPHPIPQDPILNISAIPYDVEEFDFFKIDFLHLTIYDHFKTRDEILKILEEEPQWDLLRSPSVVEQLFQIGKHFDKVQRIQPKSIIELADLNALIRPGKAQLIDKYLENRERTRKYLYTQSDDEKYSYKKSHCIAYSLIIVLQLYLISKGVEF